MNDPGNVGTFRDPAQHLEALDVSTVDRIHCKRCDQTLALDAFSPSQRRNGCWCRECRKSYAMERAKDKPRRCQRCAVEFKWWASKNARGVSTHCQECYDGIRAVFAATRHAESEALRRPVAPGVNGYRPTGKRWKKLRDQVYAEESTCGICGEAVDKTLTGSLPMAPSIDHIVQLHFGGDYYDRTNVRLAHFGCNSRDAQLKRSQRDRELSIVVAGLVARVEALESQLAGGVDGSQARCTGSPRLVA